MCRCDPALQRDLGMMSYFQLVVDPRGRDLAKRLVTNVVNQQISQDMSVSRSCIAAFRYQNTHAALDRSSSSAINCKNDAHRSVAERTLTCTKRWKVCGKRKSCVQASNNKLISIRRWSKYLSSFSLTHSRKLNPQSYAVTSCELSPDSARRS